MSHLQDLFQQNNHWPLVQKVVGILNKAGEKAFLAGGSVRDALLGHSPKDFDIATSARPEKMIQLFPQSRQQGKAFGVVAVFDSKGREVEVATFRKDGPYKDGRHPEYVEFLSDKEDALRRDFTINSLFYDLNTHQIIDWTGGLADIQKKVIRCVGDPRTRFQEDHLRILRALRFSLKLNFSIENQTQQSLFKMKDKLKDISKERVYEESLKILQTRDFVRALSAFQKVGLLEEFLGLKVDISSMLSKKVCFWQEKIPPDFIKDHVFLWAWGFFPFFINTQEYKVFLDRLKKRAFPLLVIKRLRDIRALSGLILQKEPASLGKKLKILNSPLSTYVMFLCKTYQKSQNQSLHAIEHLEQEFKLKAPQGTLPKPLVNGHDLKALGFKEDKTMASQLEQIYDIQLEQNITNKKQLLKKIRL